MIQDSFDFVLDFTQAVTDTKRANGDDYDFGILGQFVDQADKFAGRIWIESINSNAYLNGLAAVRLMTTLESGADDLARILIYRDGKHYGAPEYIDLGTEEMRKMLLAVKNETKSKELQGVDQFEAVLAALRLGGVVHEAVRKTIFELAQARHMLVHRNGVPDHRFKERCPDVPIWGAGVIRITRSDFGRFSYAVLAYMAELMLRLVSAGWDDKNSEVDWQAKKTEMELALVTKMQEPRPQTTQTFSDVLLGLEEFNRREESRKRKPIPPSEA